MTALVPPPGALTSWVELYGPQTEAPDEAHLGAAIALISAAIGWKAWIRWGENPEPCTVNVVLEGGSASARKTTVAGGAHTLARLAVKDLDDDERGLQTRSISHTSSRGLIEVVAPKDAEQAELWEQKPPPGVLLVWDEFGAVLGSPGDIKGADWLGQVRAAVMQLTNGRHGGLQTGACKIPPGRCAVSILATMTRVELEQRVSTGLLRDGFMGRFILIPFSGRPRLLAEPPVWHHEMYRQRDAIVDWLRALAQSQEELGSVFELLTPEARAARRQWYERKVEELERKAKADGDEDETGAAARESFNRLQTTALKVAVVAAVSPWRPSQPLSEIRIGWEHVHYGQELVEICLNEVMDLARSSGWATLDLYAERVKEYLAKEAKPVSRKLLLDAVRFRSLPRADRWKVIEGLHPEDLFIGIQKTRGRSAHVVHPVTASGEIVGQDAVAAGGGGA